MQICTKLSSFLLVATFTTSVFSTLLPCTNHNENSESFPDTPYLTGDYGYIYRESGKGTKSLCNISYPEGLADKTCRLVFENPNWTWGSQRGQVFNLGSPDIEAATWNSPGKAHQDEPIGTFVIEATSQPWGRAKFIEFGEFPCPKTAEARGYAIVPTWDSDSISWLSPDGGLKVEFED